MKQTKLFLSLLMLVVFGIGNVWGAEGDTHDFAQTIQQLLNNNAKINSIEIPEQNYPIKEVCVKWTYNKDIETAVSITVNVGGNKWNTIEVGNKNTDQITTFSGNVTKGKTIISFENKCGSGTGKGTFKVTNVQLVEGKDESTTEATLSSISISGTPTKTAYVVGETFDPTGLTVTGTYSDNSTKTITDGITWTCDPETMSVGVTSVDVMASVGEVMSDIITVPITVTAAPLSVTFDLTKDETESATDNMLTWKSAYATMTAAKGSGTKVTNYYPGASKNYTITRLYSGNTLTIAPQVGYVITKVVATVNTASVLTNGTWINATASTSTTSSSEVTIVPTDGTKAVAITLTKKIDFSKVTVYYTEAPSYTITVAQTTGGIIKSDKTQAKAGEKVTLSVVSTDAHYHFDGFGGYTASNKELQFEESVFTMPAESVEVFGDFVEYKKVSVYLDKQLGTVHFDGSTEKALKFYADETPTIVAENTDESKVFVKWIADDDTKVTFTDATSATTTIAFKDEDGEVTLTATYKDVPKAATITLWENGVENTSKLNGNVGEAITLPTTAGGNCNKSVEFVGWSENEITNSAAQPISKFYAPGAEYTPSAENVMLYAVYAKKKGSVVFNETFDKCDGTGGNDNQWGGSNIANNNLNTDNTGWVYEKGNGANQCAKFGVSKTDGSATTPAMNFTGDAVLTFKAGAWTGDVKILNLVATNCTLSQSSVEMKDNGWTTFEIKITAATAEPKITFSATTNASAKARFFLDEVKVSTCLYSDYSTTCAQAIDVATPTFTVEGGEYTEAQSVEILCETAGAAIYYTTDGKEPTNASTSYAGAIKVDKLMTIKAIAYVGTDNYSEVATAEYVVLQDAEVKWQTYGEDGSSKVDLTEATIYTDGDLDLFVYTPSNGKQTFTSTDESVAIVEEKTGLGGLKYLALSVKGAGTTTITVNVATDGTFAAGSASFVLHVIEHKTEVSMSFAAASYDATIGEEFTAPALTVTPSVMPIEYSSSDENVAKVDAATGEITLVGMGTATITANFAGNDAYDPATAYYTLNVTDSNVDILTIDIMNTTNGYDNFTCTGSVTGTSYVGNNMKSSKGNIQINKTPSGVVSTQSKGFLKTISVTFASENDSKHNGVDVYANVTPYETAADLYDTDKQGVKVATLSDIVGSKTVSFTVTNGNYPYIGIRAQDKVVYIEQIAIAWTQTEVIRDGLQEGEFGTVCLNRGIDAGNYLGATFYEIAYMEKQNGNPYKIFFDEVTGELVAGKPYVYVADDEQIVAAFNEQYANAPIDGANGLTGTFGDIRDGAVGLSSNILENNYVISDNKFWLCKGNCWLLANRAYIKKDILDNEPQKAPLPGRRRIEMGSGQKVPTGVDNLSENATINQALQGTYDVLGRKIAQPTGTGFYIVDGKKVIVVE